MNSLPRARRTKMVIERLGDEVLIFDEKTARGHCLTGTTARTWDLLDGTRTIAAIAAEIGLDRADVEYVLAELDGHDLLDEASPRYSRRELSRKAAKVAVAAPIIYSLSVAPAAATPTACGQVNCTANAQCRPKDGGSAQCTNTSICSGNSQTPGQCVYVA